MFLSAVSVLVVAQSSSEFPEGLMNNPVCSFVVGKRLNGEGWVYDTRRDANVYVCVCVCL